MTRSSRTPAPTSASASRQHVGGRAGDEVAAQLRDDAEAAAVVAALGNLQVGVVPGRQPQALRRHQLEEGRVRRRDGGVDRLQHRLVLVRPGDGHHLGVDARIADGVGAQAAGDDDLAVLLDRLADRLQRLGPRADQEAAGVDHDHVGRVVGRRDRVALGPQPGDDALGIDQGLGAAEAERSRPWAGSCGTGRGCAVVGRRSWAWPSIWQRRPRPYRPAPLRRGDALPTARPGDSSTTLW